MTGSLSNFNSQTLLFFLTFGVLFRQLSSQDSVGFNSHLKMSFTGSTGDVLQQVNQFVSMLDDLCENDPEAYHKFIEKQMKEGAEYSAPPELHSCLCTDVMVRKVTYYFVN